MFLCVFSFADLFLCLHLCVGSYVCVSTSLHVEARAQVCVFVGMHPTCVYIDMCIYLLLRCVQVCALSHTTLDACAFVCISVCVHLCVCVSAHAAACADGLSGCRTGSLPGHRPRGARRTQRPRTQPCGFAPASPGCNPDSSLVWSKRLLSETLCIGDVLGPSSGATDKERR